MRRAAGDAVARAERGAGAATGRGPVRQPGDLIPAPVGPATTKRLAARLDAAADQFGAERYRDAARTLGELADEAPASAEVRELRGLALYRLGRWKAATAELEAFRALTGSTEQHPVLADAYRAQGRHGEVAALWDELRQASPGAEIVTEGRIVAAGSLADQGELDAAVALLGQGFSLPKRAKEHHLRRAYALADLYERAGEAPRARDLFTWVSRQAPGFADVDRRVAALR